jgi:chromatin remodeling complex protein RSC6
LPLYLARDAHRRRPVCARSTTRRSDGKSEEEKLGEETACGQEEDRQKGDEESAKKKSGTKRVPSAAFMKPMTPSAQLAPVVGSAPLPRTEVTKKLWAYIRRKGLQDSKNRRMINADDNLRPVFGGSKQVSMFEMTRLVNKHLK